MSLGNCRVWNCADSAYVVASPSQGSVGVGVVQIASANHSVSLARVADGSYSSSTEPAMFWGSSDELQLSIEGNSGFPALKTTMAAPPPLAVTAPAPIATALPIDKTADLTVGWSTPISGSVYVSLSVETGVPDSVVPIVTPGIDCIFPAETQTGAIPSALLTQIPAPDSLVQYALEVYTYAHGSGVADDTLIDFEARWLGLSSAAVVQ
jgi:hypothetical protein